MASAPSGGGDGGGEIVAEDDPAYTEIYKNQSCAQCHGENLEGVNGPSLLGVGKKLKAEEIIQIIDNGRGAMPPGTFQGTDEEKKKLAEWLAKQK
ncbi:MAG: cytochrome c [Planifilum fulgidum]